MSRDEFDEKFQKQRLKILSPVVNDRLYDFEKCKTSQSNADELFDIINDIELDIINKLDKALYAAGSLCENFFYKRHCGLTNQDYARIISNYENIQLLNGINFDYIFEARKLLEQVHDRLASLRGCEM